MVGVGDIDLIDLPHVGLGIVGLGECRRKAARDVIPHLLPEHADPLHIRRRIAPVGCARDLVLEGVDLTRLVVRRPHSRQNIVGFAVAADISEGAGQPASDDGVPSPQEPREQR